MLDPLLTINTDVTARLLQGFIREELAKVGFSRAVLGLSGGIDSALVAALAARALGPDNVLAVMMPYTTSSPASVGDATLLAEQLGIRAMQVDISPMADPLFARFPDMSNVRRGNVMARLRMIVLYDQSATTGGLVLGTSNKTELLLGYGTQFGDMASAINPIGDLYKTQVRELAAALDVPEQIITKAPSADLWADQTDEGELGFTYEDVDRLLYYLIDERYTRSQLIHLGFVPATIDRVMELIRKSQYKRCLPLIAKTSLRTINLDFRYPRDWQGPWPGQC